METPVTRRPTEHDERRSEALAGDESRAVGASALAGNFRHQWCATMSGGLVSNADNPLRAGISWYNQGMPAEERSAYVERSPAGLHSSPRVAVKGGKRRLRSPSGRLAAAASLAAAVGLAMQGTVAG